MSSGCGDVLSLADLQTAKKHQIFEAEVITGKSGGVAGGADIDYATNQVTGQTQKTLPAVLRDAGFTPASFDFATGGTLSATDRNKTVYDPVSKTWYLWKGTLPHVIAAGTNPVGDVNWTPQTDPNLRSDLAASDGYKHIGEVQSFAALRLLVPTIAGGRVKLRGWHAGSVAGGGDFVAMATPAVDDGGTIARVNESWHWRRVPDDAIRPEMFGAIGNGTSDDSAALNNCFAAAGRLGSPVVINTDATYLSTERLTVPENVLVQGNGVMRIIRDLSMNQDLDFLTLLAGSSLIGVTVDGQRNQASPPAEVVLVRLSSNVNIDKCHFLGSRGYGLVVNGVPGVRITNSEFSDFANACIAFFGDGSSNSTDFEVSNCKFSDLGAGAIYVGGYSFGRVDNVNVSGTYVGGPGDRMYVITNTSGAITHSSGPDFTGLKPGMWVVLPGGTEHRITNVSSATNISVTPPPPSNGVFRAIAGTGDLVGVQSCAFVTVSNSYLAGGVTYGTGGGTMAGNTIPCNYCQWTNNIVQGTGKNGINISQKDAACYGNSVIGNTLIRTGSGGIGSASTYLLPALDTGAIALVQGDANMLLNTSIRDNNIITFSGDLGEGAAWLYMSGMSEGSVTCSGNSQIGHPDGYVRGDIISVDLTGYGTGALVTNNVSTGDRVIISIQTGTAPTASPSFVVKKVIRAPTEPVIMAQVATSTGSVAFCWGMQASTASAWVVGQNTTPSGNITYHIRG